MFRIAKLPNTNLGGGNWTSAQDNNNPNGNQTKFAQAVPGSATSAVFTFSTGTL